MLTFPVLGLGEIYTILGWMPEDLCQVSLRSYFVCFSFFVLSGDAEMLTVEC